MDNNTQITDILAVGDLRTKHLQKQVSVKGLVFEMNMIQPKLQMAALKCKQCKEITYIEDDLEEPESCSNCQQNGKLLFSEEDSVFTDYKEILLAKIPDEYDEPSKKYSIIVELENDLVDKVELENVVCIKGTLRTSTTNKKNRKAPNFVLNANHIEIIGQNEPISKQNKSNEITFVENQNMRSKIYILKEIMDDLGGTAPNGKIAIKDIYESAAMAGISKEMAEEIIQKMRRSGDVIMFNKDEIKKIS